MSQRSPLILKYEGGHWHDRFDQNRDEEMRFNLPDKDVFVIDAHASPPRQIDGDAGVYADVGTLLFNAVVNPLSGKIYVSNLESNNMERFEGEGRFAGETMRGQVAASRITVLGKDGSVAPRHLNKHIDYDVCRAPIPNEENATSLAFRCPWR